MSEGDLFFFLENLRIYEGEEKNSEHFARQPSLLGEIYVTDAFSVSHRNHAAHNRGCRNFGSSYAGILFEEEVMNLSSAFNPEHLYSY